MDTSKLSKATKDQSEEIEAAADMLSQTGKPGRVMGVIRSLPLEPAAVEHFSKHKSEYVWKADPIKNVREDIDGLYYAVWVTDKFDHIPILYMTEEVMKHILLIK